MRTASPEELQRFGSEVFQAHGASAENASVVAASLVKASLFGHDSHGILRIGRYVDKIRQHTLHPRVGPVIARQHGATATVDGGNGFGQVSAKFGTELAIGIARKHGIAAVALSRTNHVGRLADYAERISAEGMIALMFAGGAGPGGSVAPFGGRERVLGTNPIAWGLPVPSGRGPLVADFATSAIPEGKLAIARETHASLPENALVDRDGNPTTDAADFYQGGALLPFGGHKGYSFVLLIEIMANLLAGSVPVASAEYRPGNPAVIIAIKVAAFLDPAEFLRHTGNLLKRIESSSPAQGFGRVLAPNTVELETASNRRRDGIPVPGFIWSELEELAREKSLVLPELRA